MTMELIFDESCVYDPEVDNSSSEEAFAALIEDVTHRMIRSSFANGLTECQFWSCSIVMTSVGVDLPICYPSGTR